MKYLITALQLLDDAPPKAVAAWTEDTEEEARDSAGTALLHGYGDLDPERVVVNICKLEDPK